MTKIAAIQPASMIDYPGKVSCVVFLAGCNLHCPYCHNPELALGHMPQPVDTLWLQEFLRRRKGLLDAVVITGGEPTLNPRLPGLCRQIKQAGFAVKLDTNGTCPDVIARLLDNGLVDYLAMDIKTLPGAYRPDFCSRDVRRALLQSIELLMTRAPDYEFRTTCVAPYIDAAVIEKIGSLVRGARRYFLQAARTGTCLDSGFFKPSGPGRPLPAGQLEQLKEILSAHVQECRLR